MKKTLWCELIIVTFLSLVLTNLERVQRQYVSRKTAVAGRGIRGSKR